ncbi:uncharacterized protein LAJ45_05893 [Morchella importuna]|uniref:uncharacterized protein n=1 Tax=Morchella importuna TaxID=1174673 RepID=UPI001E8CDA19|nr:uncharacterized protein LAJ45_05893 [Morchella importuna]KAH8150207.1 hypothetical protein LAJ45_05893 [Morchella importuna]
MEVGAVPVLLSGGKEKKRNAKKRNRDLRDLLRTYGLVEMLEKLDDAYRGGSRFWSVFVRGYQFLRKDNSEEINVNPFNEAPVLINNLVGCK